MKYPATRRKADLGAMACGECGAETVRTSAVQKYCRPCSAARDKARKQHHAHTRGKEKYESRKTQFGDRGAALNAAEKLDLVASTPPMPKMVWYKRVGVPFSWAGSKNHIFSSTSRGHVFMRDESRYMRTLLTEKVAEAVASAPLVQNKLWIDIFVQKPRQNGDAVNFVDMVCDAVKDALPLDDRWYCLRAVDWQIAKQDPMLFVGVGQDADVNVQACSSCGRLLTFDMFQRHKGLKHGIGRNCRDCMAVREKSVKRDRAHAAMIIEHRVGVFG